MTRPSRLLPRIFPLIAVLTLAAAAAAPNLPDAAKLIADAKRDWALAVASGDTSIVEQIVLTISLESLWTAPNTTNRRRCAIRASPPKTSSRIT